MDIAVLRVKAMNLLQVLAPVGGSWRAMSSPRGRGPLITVTSLCAGRAAGHPARGTIRPRGRDNVSHLAVLFAAAL
jgi:hypothetical protein